MHIGAKRIKFNASETLILSVLYNHGLTRMLLNIIEQIYVYSLSRLKQGFDSPWERQEPRRSRLSFAPCVRRACSRAPASRTNLSQPTGSAAIALILQLDRDVIRIGEIQLRRAHGACRAAATCRALAQPHAGGQWLDRAAELDRLQSIVDQHAHGTGGIEIPYREADMVDPANSARVGGRVEDNRLAG